MENVTGVVSTASTLTTFAAGFASTMLALVVGTTVLPTNTNVLGTPVNTTKASAAQPVATSGLGSCEVGDATGAGTSAVSGTTTSTTSSTPGTNISTNVNTNVSDLVDFNDNTILSNNDISVLSDNQILSNNLNGTTTGDIGAGALGLDLGGLLGTVTP